jgi:hypothetical protein
MKSIIRENAGTTNRCLRFAFGSSLGSQPK